MSTDLEELEVWADGDEPRTILGGVDSSPVLVDVFPSPTLMTDSAAIAERSAGTRDVLFSLYGSYPRRVTYDGVSVDWSPTEYPGVWGPSIDTLFLARTLRRMLPGVRSLCEIGTGSGFLTKFAIVHGNLERATASDIDLAAIRCAHAALADVDAPTAVSLVMPESDAPTLGIGASYDLVVTNPPYIPRPEAAADNPYEGLALVRRLADEADSLVADGGRILLNLSSCATDEPLEWFRARGWAVEALEEMRVPLKVNAVVGGASARSRAWTAYLEDRGLVEREPGGRYDHWHRLRAFSITRR